MEAKELAQQIFLDRLAAGQKREEAAKASVLDAKAFESAWSAPCQKCVGTVKTKGGGNCPHCKGAGHG